MDIDNSGLSITLPALKEAENIEEFSEEIVRYCEEKNIPGIEPQSLKSVFGINEFSFL